MGEQSKVNPDEVELTPGDGLIVVDTKKDSVVATLPSGHAEVLSMVQAEALAFALLDSLKDDWK